MKCIKKHQEPRRFSVWKANQRPSRRLSWNRFRPPLKAEVHRSLLREQGYICCYCESRVQVNDSHIEHFHPRSRYPGLALDYENLHCSCLRDLKPGQPRHCGHEKRSWFDDKLLISPLQPDCETRFAFTPRGEIYARSSNDVAAQTTIRKLSLDSPNLNRYRRAAVNALIDVPRREIERLLVRQSDGTFPEYFTTIKDILPLLRK